MKASLGKWDGSLALRIPGALAAGRAGSGFARGTFAPSRRLIVTPLRPPPLRRDDLLCEVTADNLHGEIDTGPSIGGEVW